ncbi:MAG: methylated-DNA--[protein]-cysteine S-methyltransferase [Armatimonadota bacterium]|nr:methylated-DNA--[protein]-cysteine S-methyltransferase [Armatimonadota bacterium]MDR5702062.1 methylated-DNA--[protein]-cysteine S-methyltransferase [Armatimonadota bacterium]MDR7434587.1 methylated-DNA--[protein]-cysteine S-methyltransferase [Armatimonadota bacterium]
MKNKALRIRYTVTPCPLGNLLVAATEKGICSVMLGTSPAELEALLVKEYPHAEFHRDPAGLDRWVRVLLKYLNGQQRALDLPLDVRGTAFQQRVWEELRRIPYGSTRTYSDIARAVGRPKASRAVARACATNPVALLIPCHRVVRKGGDPGGFGWGVERKRALLALEQSVLLSSPGSSS